MWYRFNHWAYIDIFVYFGHYTVTLPPPGLVNIAHHYGVKVLGTLIFEWEAGAIEAKLLLDGKVLYHPNLKDQELSLSKEVKDGNKFYARKLAEVARELGFDGYLMNFEC